MAVYYRFYDTEEKEYLAMGYNGTIDYGVRDELIEYLDSADGDEIFQDATIDTICEFTGWLKCEKKLGYPFPAVTEDGIEDVSYNLYHSHGGYSVVIDHINLEQEKKNPVYKNIEFKYCEGCESDMPSLHGSCLICGQGVE